MFCCFVKALFLLNKRFQERSCIWSLLTDSLLQDTTLTQRKPFKLFKRRQIWTAVRSVNRTHDVSTKSHCSKSCRMRSGIVLLKQQQPPWEDLPDGCICRSKHPVFASASVILLWAAVHRRTVYRRWHFHLFLMTTWIEFLTFGAYSSPCFTKANRNMDSSNARTCSLFLLSSLDIIFLKQLSNLLVQNCLKPCL